MASFSNQSTEEHSTTSSSLQLKPSPNQSAPTSTTSTCGTKGQTFSNNSTVLLSKQVESPPEKTKPLLSSRQEHFIVQQEQDIPIHESQKHEEMAADEDSSSLVCGGLQIRFRETSNIIY